MTESKMKTVKVAPQKTHSVKPSEISRTWYVVDASANK
jgi:hypothetical protein